MKKVFILCDTQCEIPYDAYLEYCEINEIEPQSQDSHDFFEFVSRMQAEEWEDFKINVEHSKVNNYVWVVEGSLGLWDGRHEIIPNAFSSLISALNACCYSCNDVVITKHHSEIRVRAMHHDGVHYFTLRALSDIGEERYNKHTELPSLNNKRNLRTLEKYFF